MFFRAVTTPLMTPVPNFNKWCAVSNFLFKNIDFCIFTPKTPSVKENYFLTLWNFTYLKDTSFGKKLCNFELGLETKNEFEKWPLYNIVSVYVPMSSSKRRNLHVWTPFGPLMVAVTWACLTGDSPFRRKTFMTANVPLVLKSSKSVDSLTTGRITSVSSDIGFDVIITGFGLGACYF